ncbi:MAG: hypothetical protein A3K19_28325 [Lentisphaerae bacterium RIFOXYB12_FULL_65_16]|nr:MAG: hypothetical protein A3K18_19575 [Lentisphaerae bacterium RIFOXYA12_64_32]OGV85496.1 MAG: hypothetical protein A3K19_28325 [Lentisphaerae bacterium RIFOXYB12_FULL_65_16]
MKIFLVLSNAPDPHGEAIEVVADAIIRQAAKLGHCLDVQVLLRDPRESPAGLRTERLVQEFNLDHVNFCPLLFIQDVATRPTRGAIGKLVNMLGSLEMRRLFPAVALGPEVERRVRAARADCLLSVWSWEALAATFHIRGLLKFAYYGNPDHLPTAARLKHPGIAGIPCRTLTDKLKFHSARLQNWRRKRLHLWMMNQTEVTANNSVLDVDYYRRHGHPRSIYIQNMWPSLSTPLAGREPDADVIRIIGSVGNLGATGNSFGLHYIGKELMPRLRQRADGRRVEMHIIGRGTPRPGVAPHLDQEGIVLRGWVEDINQELRNCHAFLVMTNANPDFLVGNTRILLAWALRTCVIMHANSGLAMPEIEHNQNALLGNTPEELVDQILRVASDPALRRRIGDGGYQTYEKYYREDVVVPRMMSILEAAVKGFRANGSPPGGLLSD